MQNDIVMPTPSCEGRAIGRRAPEKKRCGRIARVLVRSAREACCDLEAEVLQRCSSIKRIIEYSDARTRS